MHSCVLATKILSLAWVASLYVSLNCLSFARPKRLKIGLFQCWMSHQLNVRVMIENILNCEGYASTLTQY